MNFDVIWMYRKYLGRSVEQYGGAQMGDAPRFNSLS